LHNGGPISPLLVPPTSSKASYHKPLAAAWERAAKELLEAESIVVIGYSMPPTDVFFRHFLALSTMSDAVIDRVIVVDPRNDGAENFKEMFGPAVIARDVFHHKQSSFSGALPALAYHFGLDRNILEAYANRGGGMLNQNDHQYQVAEGELMKLLGPNSVLR